MVMKKYIPYVRVHCKDGDLEVFEAGGPEYDSFEDALRVSETIRAEMLQVDKDSNPTALVLVKVE